MLSPGHYYKLIPKDITANIKRRMAILRLCSLDKRTQRGFKEMCKHDLRFFIDIFVWQSNPLKKGAEKVGPFILWDFQERALFKVPGVYWPGEDDDQLNDAGLLWCLENDHSLVIEKSREMGASWLCILLFVWLLLFHPHMTMLCVSKNEEAVDDDSSDSLFWKVRWVLEHMPVWLKPKAFRDKNRFFGNDDLRSQFTGSPNTASFSVGGRCDIILMDEFSKFRFGKEIRERTANTTNCRIFNSTHDGMDTEFFNLCQQPEIKKLHMHWTQHPDKVAGLYRSSSPVEVIDKQYVFPEGYKFVMDGSPLGGPRPGIRSPWYDRKCRDIGSTTGAAIELDINPQGTVSQVFEPMLVRELIEEYCTDPIWEGDLEHERDTGRNANLVMRVGGSVKLWVWPSGAAAGPPGRHAAGADISMGTGASPSCLAIANADTGEKVMQFQSARMKPDQFAVFCFAMLGLFKSDSGDLPLLCFEIQGPGVTFRQEMLRLGYGNFYDKSMEPSLNKIETAEPGWTPTPQSKKDLVTQYQAALRKREFLNRSEGALKDLLAWKYNVSGGVDFAIRAAQQFSDDPSGARDNHGDQTVADALCCKMCLLLGLNRPAEQKFVTAVGSLAWRRLLHHNAQKTTKWM